MLLRVRLNYEGTTPVCKDTSFKDLTLGKLSTGISKRKILLTVYELGLAGAPCQSIVIP